ncbi:MAG: response regulator [Bacteroidota bacterium]
MSEKDDSKSLIDQTSPNQAVTGGGETILLVEDEEVLLDLLQVLLESEGYHTMTAANGEDAVEIYRKEKEKIAIVLSDMGLPKLGGWEVLRVLRDINPAVKVILASGYLDQSLKAEMIKAGAKDFVQKPYIPDQILKRIREVIGGS